QVFFKNNYFNLENHYIKTDFKIHIINQIEISERCTLTIKKGPDNRALFFKVVCGRAPISLK
ncbi:MAG: hypothetical protein ABGY43_18970, partial [bacterium]